MFRLFFISFLFFTSVVAQEHKGGYTFIQNKKQWHPNVLFKADVQSGYFYIEKDGFLFDMVNVKKMNEYVSAHYDKQKQISFDSLEWHSYKVTFEDCNPNVVVYGEDKAPEYYNYFIGDNPDKWAGNVSAYHSINYGEVYTNIDARIYTKLFDLKYDFIVKKGGSPQDIRLSYKGADKVEIREERLHIYTTVNHVVEDKPFAYQIINKKVVPVECKYRLKNEYLSFDFPNGYNENYDLVIDPTLKFSTFSGSFSDNFGYAATFDSKGFLYSGSSTFGNQYPTTIGAYSTSFNGGIVDIAISKFDTTGTFLIYSTFIGGNSDELPHSLIVNSLDELFILGTTSSPNYPTTAGCYDATFNGGTPNNLQNGLGVNYTNGSDIVISHLSANGANLLGSTYLGGSQNDGLNSTSTNRFLNLLRYNYADEIRGEIDIDKNNNIYVVTCTRSPDYPTTSNAFQSAYGGGALDACITKLDNALQNVIWSSFLGGEEHDAGYSLALDNNDDLIVTGGTNSLSFPTTSGAYQTSFQGGRSDGFITKISKNGQTILNSTYYGSSAYDQSYFVEVDKANDVYVFGQTEHTGNNFIQNASWNIPGSGQFISKFNPQLSTRIYSTVFGSGNGINISPTAFLVDVCDKIYLSGWGGVVNHLGSLYNNTGYTTNMPISSDAYQSTTDGSDFYLMVMQVDASALVYGSYFGSPSAPEHVDGGTSRFDRKGRIYQAICAGCGGDSNLPTFPSNVVSTTNNNSCNLAVFKMDFDIPSVVADFIAPPIGCAPYSYTFQNTSLSLPNTSFHWDFGDGTTSSVENPSHTFTQQGTYIIQLILTDIASCNLADTITREVQVLDNSTTSLSDVNICPGESVQIGLLPNVDPSITYQWSPSSGLSNASASNPFASPFTTINYQLLISNGICTDTVYQKVVVNTPLLSVSNDTSLCFLPATIDLTANSFGTCSEFIWSSTYLFNDTLNTTVSDSIMTLSPSSTSTYFVKANNNGCEITDSVKVTTVYGNVSLPGSTSICQGDTVTLTATSSFDNGVSVVYNWSPFTGVLNGVGTGQVQVRPPQTTTYQLIIDADACLDTLSTLVGVTAVDVFIPNDTIVCNANMGVNFTATSSLGNTSFIWSSTPQFLDTINGNTNNGSVYVLPQNDTSLYILAESNGCSVIDSVSVDIVFGQTSIIAPVTGCQGSEVVLQATNTASTNNVNYNWEPDLFIISGDGTPIITAAPLSNVTFVLYAENAGCYDTLQHFIAITPIQLSTSSDTVLCFDTMNIEIYATAYGITNNYVWSSSSSFSDTLNQPLTDSAISISGSNYGVYYVRIENGGCTLVDSVEIETAFSNPSINASTQVCFGDTISLIANSGIGGVNVNYDWSPNSEIINGDGTSIITSSPHQNVHYTSVLTYQYCLDTLFFDVNVVHLSLNTSNDTILCSDTSVFDIWASAAGTANSYVWSSSNSFNDTLNNPIQDSSLTISPTAPTVYYVMINENGCELIDSVEVTVATGQLELDYIQEICKGDMITITVNNLSPNIPFTYDWSPDSLILSGDGTASITISPDTTTTYTLTGTNSYGCIVTISAEVSINPIAFGGISANATSDTIVEGQSTTLFALPNQNSYFYTWVEVINGNNTSVEVSPESTTTYYLTGEYNGCTKTDSITIFVKELTCGESDVYLPNAFTPNKDNANDKLYVRGNNIGEMLLRIYDRWGELIFETSDQAVGWDGTYKGKDCDPAVFVYYLEVKCKKGDDTYFEKGNITLIR